MEKRLHSQTDQLGSDLTLVETSGESQAAS
jgi:hypothetical protein